MTSYPTRGLKPSHTPPRNRGHHNERVRRIGLLETDPQARVSKLFTGPRRPAEYDSIEYGRLPVNYRLSPILLAYTVFRNLVSRRQSLDGRVAHCLCRFQGAGSTVSAAHDVGYIWSPDEWLAA